MEYKSKELSQFNVKYKAFYSNDTHVQCILFLNFNFGKQTIGFLGLAYLSEWSSSFSDCGGIYELNEINSTIEITSPNYPQNYDNLQECAWYLKVRHIYHIGNS